VVVGLLVVLVVGGLVVGRLVLVVVLPGHEVQATSRGIIMLVEQRSIAVGALFLALLTISTHTRAQPIPVDNPLTVPHERLLGSVYTPTGGSGNITVDLRLSIAEELNIFDMSGGFRCNPGLHPGSDGCFIRRGRWRNAVIRPHVSTDPAAAVFLRDFEADVESLDSADTCHWSGVAAFIADTYLAEVLGSFSCSGSGTGDRTGRFGLSVASKRTH